MAGLCIFFFIFFFTCDNSKQFVNVLFFKMLPQNGVGDTNCFFFYFPFQNIKLISILVQQGKLQEEELESVLKYLFPTK